MRQEHQPESPAPRDWSALTAEVGAQFSAWRQEHPRATWQEIEGTLDAHWHQVRARVLEEAAATSPTAHLPSLAREARPLCPHCQVPLQARGTKERQVRVEGDQAVTLRRSYAVCPRCGEGFFPSG